jgi:hypothetical protein
VGGEQPHRGEVDRAALEHLQDHRKTPHRSGDRDAVVGFLLGEAEDVSAVGEERAVAGPKVHVARVELREVRHEQDHGSTLASGEIPDASDELGVGQASEGREKVLHAPLYPGSLSAQVRNGPSTDARFHRCPGNPRGRVGRSTPSAR